MKTNFYKTTKLTGLLVLMLCANFLKAQYDAQFTNYMFNEMFINPAYAGSNGAMSATLLHRQQWVNFSGRPVTTSFSLHGPIINDKMGVGISVLNERIGVLQRNLIYGDYAYRIKVQDKGTLALGLMAGVDMQVNRFSELKVNDNGITDPQLSMNSPNIVAPNMGTGVYYHTKSFYGGFSIPRLIDNQVSFNNGGAVKTSKVEFKKFTYYFTAGNMFTINDEFKLRANAMIKYVASAPIQLDLGANLLIREMFWTGLSFRTGSAISLLLGYQVNSQFLVNYSYDYGVNQIQKYSQGSHEFVLSYLFAYKDKKVVTPRYF
ncbi:MAG: type IX secretion system membrane protein PorP/SprF [Bacteroidia bacterium]|jgi:type IX secretion system PorP/SprF family membrane protein|nr:type IX secretion system membrane protein PorP/SprF [Bacteroidia bacterium]